MANMAHDHETVIEQDAIGRLAAVIAQLVQAGVLQWSAHGRKPVTRQTGLEDEIEEYIRNG